MAFHAHPDDEALLTAGTLARAAAEGHRVVLVLATDGAAGLASADLLASGDLGERRREEARRSAAALGCARVEFLGYDDSGMANAPSGAPNAFRHVDPDIAADRLAALLREEGADVLTSYDAAGGYGHPDHVQVHHVGVRAAERAGTPVVLEATIDRRPLLWAVRIAHRLPGLAADPAQFATAYSGPDVLTHRVDVSRYAGQKRAAMAAHASQASADTGMRTLSLLRALPGPVFRRVLGHEWYVERGRPPRRPLLDDIFATLRD